MKGDIRIGSIRNINGDANLFGLNSGLDVQTAVEGVVNGGRVNKIDFQVVLQDSGENLEGSINCLLNDVNVPERVNEGAEIQN